MTLIDNIFLNGRIQNITHSSVILHDISDHFPCLAVIEDIFMKKRVNRIILSRDINDTTIAQLKIDLSGIDWDQLLSEENPTKAYDSFESVISDLLDKNMPQYEKVITYKHYLSEPWLMKGLVKCGKKQMKLYEKSIKSGNENDIIKYKNYKSALQRIKRRCKIDYYHDKCSKFKNNTKRL